jgi:hypothetical protein
MEGSAASIAKSLVISVSLSVTSALSHSMSVLLWIECVCLPGVARTIKFNWEYARLAGDVESAA